MSKSSKSDVKKFHPRNLHNTSYNFKKLITSHPALSQYVKVNQHGIESIDFSNPDALRLLNAAILKSDYKIQNWDIPKGTLCPPIPGRADYIHYVADLLKAPKPNSKIKLLDIGTGANGIYPILAHQIYNWHCVGSDINNDSLTNIKKVLKSQQSNHLENSIELRLQQDKHKMFDGIIQKDEYFDITVCNPPFHASEKDAIQSSNQKNKNLEISSNTLNFGGQANELWCNGGEKLFLKKMIKESFEFKTQVKWFSSLVSKSENLKPSIKLINKLGAKEVKEIEMIQGNKTTRILAWCW